VGTTRLAMRTLPARTMYARASLVMGIGRGAAAVSSALPARREAEYCDSGRHGTARRGISGSRATGYVAAPRAASSVAPMALICGAVVSQALNCACGSYGQIVAFNPFDSAMPCA
jgi:hypothetical protein